ncbi:MAG: ethanolamine ammonia-lyase subunit EutC [Alphaproteobacteria bacterium]|nr:ethanolamine ammonia-lyase subunit EutC [Alphaproteobacteria bacterium]
MSQELGAPDPWLRLAGLTPPRIALGRVGPSLPTGPVLQLALAHARARDAVHAALDTGRLAGALRALGPAVLTVASAAPSREVYLRRPDLGRRLASASRTALAARAARQIDLALVVGDGLSAAAVQAHAAPLIACLLRRLDKARLTLAPVVIATQARVALGDEIGELLQARAAVILIGERPGLSAPDSLGAYLTYAPRCGRVDAERNCVSNIRAGGLTYEVAARKLAWLLNEALRSGVSGVALKDDSGRRVLDAGSGA